MSSRNEMFTRHEMSPGGNETPNLIETTAPRGSAGLDLRRRRILFRSRHRGMREMDLIMGGFANAHLSDLLSEDLDALEILLDLPDQEVFSWLTGETVPPPVHDTPVFRKLRVFSYS